MENQRCVNRYSQFKLRKNKDMIETFDPVELENPYNFYTLLLESEEKLQNFLRSQGLIKDGFQSCLNSGERMKQ